MTTRPELDLGYLKGVNDLVAERIKKALEKIDEELDEIQQALDDLETEPAKWG